MHTMVERASSSFAGKGMVKRASSSFGGKSMVERASSSFGGKSVVERASSSFRLNEMNDQDGRSTRRASSFGGKSMVERASSSFGKERKNDQDGRSTIPHAILFPDAMRHASAHFFSPRSETAIHVRNLPHWAQEGTLVFVTFRLADSIPQEKLREWEALREAWLKHHPEPWDADTKAKYMRLFPEKLEEWLDAGYGSCILADGECRAIVEEAMEHFDCTRYRLHACVVMPNHVHVLVEMRGADAFAPVLHSWKSFTANALNRATGKTGPVWQHESYDRLVRTAKHYENVVEYIKRNARGNVVEKVVERASSSFENEGKGVVERASSSFEKEKKMNDQDGRSTTRASSSFRLNEMNDQDGRSTTSTTENARNDLVERASSSFEKKIMNDQDGRSTTPTTRYP